MEYIAAINAYLDEELATAKLNRIESQLTPAGGLHETKKLIIKLASGIVPDYEPGHIFLLLGPPQEIHLFTYLDSTKNLPMSCIALLHSYYPEKITEELNSYKMNTPLRRRIISSIYIRFLYKDDIENPIRTFMLYVKMGLDITDFGFVYNFVHEMFENYLFYRSGLSEVISPVANATFYILKECFRKGFSLSTFDIPKNLREHVAVLDCFNKHGIVCTNYYSGNSGNCCVRCVIYEIIWTVYKEYMNETSLFQLLCIDLERLT